MLKAKLSKLTILFRNTNHATYALYEEMSILNLGLYSYIATYLDNIFAAGVRSSVYFSMLKLLGKLPLRIFLYLKNLVTISFEFAFIKGCIFSHFSQGFLLATNFTIHTILIRTPAIIRMRMQFNYKPHALL